MAKRAAPDVFKRGETVKTLDPLPGVPQGEKGRLYLVNGLVWTRYRVLFENGVDIGSIDGSSLARPADYDDALERRARAAEATQAAASDTGSDGEAAAAGGGGGDKTVNGVVVPALLLDRSKAARERLAAA